MGHLAQREEVLRELRKRLHRNPIGLPEHATVYEILSILFSEREAWVGARFPFGAVTLHEISQAVGIAEPELSEILEGMARKGLVISTKKAEERRYVLAMSMTGFFEFTFMRTNESLPMKRLAELMYTYRHTPEFVQEFFGSPTPRGRALIYGDVLPPVRSEVFPYEEAAEQIRKAGRGALTKCYCRHEASHLGRNCGAPIDDICMSLGQASDFLVEQGFARRATVGELLATLKRAEDLGLVHIGDNIQENLTFLCNCCGCCCGFLQGITKHHLKHAVATTHFIAQVDPERCSHCGDCAERCPIQAIQTRQEGPVIDQEVCLGCGICSHFCPSEGIQMVEREQKVIPPKTYKDLMIRLMKEKGRL